MNDLTEILNRLPKLNPSEREQVRLRLVALGSFGDMVKHVESDTFEDQVLGTIRDTLSAAGVEHVSMHALKHSPFLPAFRNKMPGLAAFFKPMQLTKNELSALLMIGIKLLYANLRDMNVPIGARTMMNHIHRLPSIFNVNFPMYAQAGLLPIIVRRPKHDSAIRGPQRLTRRLQGVR